VDRIFFAFPEERQKVIIVVELILYFCANVVTFNFSFGKSKNHKCENPVDPVERIRN